MEDNFIKEWESIVSAQKVYGFIHISAACKGKRKHAGGFKWKYKEAQDD